MQLVVVGEVAIERHVHAARLVPRRQHPADVRLIRDADVLRDVRPRLPAVARELNLPVIAARVDDERAQRRLGDCRQRSVIALSVVAR